MIRKYVLDIARKGLVGIGRLVTWPLLELRIEGREHLPTHPARLILIANHFSWFDPPVLALALPFAPAFLVATEVRNRWWTRLLVELFECIPIWRGQVNRQAFRQTLQALDAGKVVTIFPEGGVNPALAEQVARGETIAGLQGNTARQQAQLAQARSGVAMIAVMSGAPVLPVALFGTEQILANLRQFRRTSITVRIGPVFGPLAIETHLTGQTRRRRLDALAHAMMHRIAMLFPPEKRGYYQEVQNGIESAG
jgi:1-acyl-sn-glycerol-3-phosphate acyltransferase